MNEDKMNLYDNSGNGLIEKTLEDVLHDSMIPYTEHVVLDRALPRVEDGLKPVQRRILYSMLELGVTPDKPYRKSARIVGDCMGKYHPHGDSSVYDAMVRMSQDFSMSAPLIDGHGNFGSIDGDGAAAMRYTEAKLKPLAMELLRDIEKNTIRWTLNFDDSLKEPDILPGRFPNLLVNGAYGIAVGLATNIPPHNLGEVVSGVCAYIDGKNTLDEVMKYIPAPDFPTGGLITAGEELLNAYKTGKGKITIRAKVHIETKGDKSDLVITELPYQVNKANLLQKIAELKTEGKGCLGLISDIRDESDRAGMRAVIRLKKEANPKEILQCLYKATNLQTSFGINMVAIAGGKPKQMGLIEIIDYYVNYQRDVVYRRTKYDLDEAKAREHIVNGLLIAIKNIDEVIRIIKKSSTTADARTKLKEMFLLSDKQAQAILDMRLARLVNLEVTKLENELMILKEKIKEYTEICSNKKMQLAIVKAEMLEIKKKFGEPRRSEIIGDLEIDFSEDNEEYKQKDVYLAISKNNLIKTISLKNYSMSSREISESTTENNIHTNMLKISPQNKVLIFLASGNALYVDVSKIPEAKWREKGVSLKTFDSAVKNDDYAVSIVPVDENIEGKNLIFTTKKAYVKLSRFSDYTISKTYFQAIKLKEDDSVLSVEIDDDNSTLVLVSKTGMTLNMLKDDIPLQGRISGGVIGMNIDDNDYLVCSKQNSAENNLIVCTDLGYVKKVSICEFDPLPRNRKGLRIIPLSVNGTKLVYAAFEDNEKGAAFAFGEGFKELSTYELPVEPRFSKGNQKITDEFNNIIGFYK